MAGQDTDDAPSPNHPPTIPDKPGREKGTENYLTHSASNLSIPRPPESGKRRLLLIYVHGFNGSEASFHAFPAHVHSLLTDALAESHEVYTRIYPRYKSRGDMKIARDQFSSWLSPHEADDLDVILLGHSLGGILTADVALLPSSPLHSHRHRKHHILGLINFDVPFLGLHPGIIQTSCKSLFQRDRDQSPAEHEPQTFTETETQITAEALAAFSPTHYDPPFFNDTRWAERSGMQGVVHFFEKNYNRLAKSMLTRIVSPYEFAGCLNNYPTLRRQYKQLMDMEAAHDQTSRIRFVNYYTASEAPETVKEKEKDPATLKNKDNTGESEHSPRASMEHLLSPVDVKENIPCTEEQSEKEPEPEPCPLTPTSSQPEPEPQPEPDQSDCTCASDTADCTSKQHKKKKRRKFVLLPSHHWSHGDDSLWIPVNMDNMNEITAHQSLFLPHGRNYDQLVGDTMATIEQWIQADLTRRMLMQEEQETGSGVYKGP